MKDTREIVQYWQNLVKLEIQTLWFVSYNVNSLQSCDGGIISLEYSVLYLLFLFTYW